MVGMGVSNLVALFIVLTTAATLHAHGVTNVETSADAAKALKPIAGELAFAVFALGIVGTGLLAVPVLAGSAAYALGETLGWRIGLDERAARAPAFYLAIAGATLLGGLLNFSPLDPIKALIFSAIVNGVVAVPVMVMIMIMASRREVMGDFALIRCGRTRGFTATSGRSARKTPPSSTPAQGPWLDRDRGHGRGGGRHVRHLEWLNRAVNPARPQEAQIS